MPKNQRILKKMAVWTMISYLEGRVLAKEMPYVTVLAGFVGYAVAVCVETWQALPLGESTQLWIETVPAESGTQLFGFLDPQARRWFRWLVAVPGVGGKSALHILSVLPPAALACAIIHEHTAALRNADGVGPKLAARLCTELKDKARHWSVDSGIHLPLTRAPSHESASPQPQALPGDGAHQPDAVSQALSALVALGYNHAQAHRAVQQVHSTWDGEIQNLVKLALGVLNPSL